MTRNIVTQHTGLDISLQSMTANDSSCKTIHVKSTQIHAPWLRKMDGTRADHDHCLTGWNAQLPYVPFFQAHHYSNQVVTKHKDGGKNIHNPKAHPHRRTMCKTKGINNILQAQKSQHRWKPQSIVIRGIALQYFADSEVSLPRAATSNELAPPCGKWLKLVQSSQLESRSTCYSSSWLRRRALPFVTETFNCAARSTMAFLFSVETLCAISALYFLQSYTGHIYWGQKPRIHVLVLVCNCNKNETPTHKHGFKVVQMYHKNALFE